MKGCAHLGRQNANQQIVDQTGPEEAFHSSGVLSILEGTVRERVFNFFELPQVCIACQAVGLLLHILSVTLTKEWRPSVVKF
mmetsp:Transcript_2200/g.5780  ORF Transcript_2200/g.5780 Transcript_2200/m.5780 type:complete len:82 (+) Transcript_2200:275-520(+)